MGVVGEAGALANAEVVEHEERGEVTEDHGSNGPPHHGPDAFLGFDGENALNDRSGESGHGWWL